MHTFVVFNSFSYHSDCLEVVLKWISLLLFYQVLLWILQDARNYGWDVNEKIDFNWKKLLQKKVSEVYEIFSYKIYFIVQLSVARTRTMN